MAVGKVGDFDIKSDVWAQYIERVEQYFIVNDVKEEKKVPILITLLGKSTYELAVNLCHPDNPSKKTFQELTKVISLHVNPKPSVLAERYKFRQKKQKSDETISEFMQELKKLSRFCDFFKNLDENMRDQLVCGLKSYTIRQRLFAENKVTIIDALKLATSLEAAERDAAIVEGTIESCHAVKTSQQRHIGGGGSTEVDNTQYVSRSLGRTSLERRPKSV